MSTIKNHINSYADMTSYNSDLNKEFPNISYIQGTDEVKMYKYDPEYIVAVYNVTSTSSATKLLGSTSYMSKMWIDGVEQESLVTTYQFDTIGAHTVKLQPTGNTITSNFEACKNLIQVTLPPTINRPYGTTFYNSTTPFVVIQNKNGFSFNTLTNSWHGIVYVPKGTVETYKALNLNTYKNILELPNQSGAEIVCTMSSNQTGGKFYTNNANYFFKHIYIDGAEVNANTNSYNWNADSIIRAQLYDQRSIPEYIFAYVNSSDGTYFKNVVIPSTVEIIGNEAFEHCRQLQSVTVLATTPPTLGTSVFRNNASGRKIYVPAESVEAYKAAPNWSTYAADIEAIPNS